jgi:hypothetical protein
MANERRLSEQLARRRVPRHNTAGVRLTEPQRRLLSGEDRLTEPQRRLLAKLLAAGDFVTLSSTEMRVAESILDWIDLRVGNLAKLSTAADPTHVRIVVGAGKATPPS